MTTKQEELITLTVRVSRTTADRFREQAERRYRPVAAEIRRLIEESLEDEPDLKKAA